MKETLKRGTPPGTDKPCEKCGALAGETCIRPNGQELRRFHQERR